ARDRCHGQLDAVIVVHDADHAVPSAGFGVPVAGVFESGDLDLRGGFDLRVGGDHVGLATLAADVAIGGVEVEIDRHFPSRFVAADGHRLPGPAGVAAGSQDHQFASAVTQTQYLRRIPPVATLKVDRIDRMVIGEAAEL